MGEVLFTHADIPGAYWVKGKLELVRQKSSFFASWAISNRVDVLSELRTPRSLTIDTNEKQANVSSPM